MIDCEVEVFSHDAVVFVVLGEYELVDESGDAQSELIGARIHVASGVVEVYRKGTGPAGGWLSGYFRSSV